MLDYDICYIDIYIYIYIYIYPKLSKTTHIKFGFSSCDIIKVMRNYENPRYLISVFSLCRPILNYTKSNSEENKSNLMNFAAT